MSSLPMRIDLRLAVALVAAAALSILEVQAGERVSLRLEVLPALTKHGCNAGACHGSPSGKGGFRLSLRGFDPDLDQATLIREAFGRRTNRSQPERSLLLLKPTMQVAHGGGRKLRESDPAYQILRDWIAQGCQPDAAGAPQLLKLEVMPSARELQHPDWQQSIVARAHFSDGSARDVTSLADFLVTDDQIASIAADGKVVGIQRGEAVVLARYLDQIGVTALRFLRDVPGFEWPEPAENNFIDTHLFRKLKRLQIVPSDLCSDSEFLRRISLDVTGRLPNSDQARSFLADSSPDKRQRIIEDLLASDAYADFWALKLGDLLQVKGSKLSPAGVHKFHKWLVDAVRENMPYDQLALTLLTAQGSAYENPPAAFYRTTNDANACSEVAAQLFLGVRIQCAKCHNHPYERWTQDHYYGLGAFFSRVRSRQADTGDDVVVWLAPSGEVTHPRTGQPMHPLLPVGGGIQIAPQQDRREVFARWLVTSENPFFAKLAVNRIWGHVMGRGLVDPIDDFRESNPASHPELLDALAAEFVKSGFDQKHILRTILRGRTYQLSSATNEFNASDARYFSHARARPLSAEQLLDAICHVTGIPEKYAGLPLGIRATQLPSPDVGSDFLKVFGQPARNTACECERADEPKLTHALQMISGELIARKLKSPGSLLSRLTDDFAARVQAAGSPPTKDLRLWLKADSGALDANGLATADGELIASWRDHSPSGRHVVQSDRACQPRLVNRSIGDLPVLRFDGDDVLHNTVDSAVEENGPRTVIMVGQAGPTDAGGSLLTFRRATGGGRTVFTAQHVLYQGSFYVYSDGVNGSGNATIPPTNIDVIRKPFLTTFVSAGAGEKLIVQLNGRPVDVAQPGVVGPDNGLPGFTIGNREDYPGFGWRGDIAEILVFARVLSSDELAAAGAYLTTKFALETAYPPRPVPRTQELANRDREILRDLYLSALTREPTADELQVSLDYIAQSEDRRQGFEDVIWALLNSKEFLFQH